MTLTIEGCANGYVVKTYDDEGNHGVWAFEDSDTEWGELEAFQRMLWNIVDYFGFYGSKHDARRIRIIIEENPDNHPRQDLGGYREFGSDPDAS